MRIHWKPWTPLWVIIVSCVVGCGGEETSSPESVGAGQAEAQDAAPSGPRADSSSNQPPVPQDPEVTIETSLGLIVVQLDVDNAPLTVDNFLWYVNNGHYDGTIFHQVESGYVVLGGGYTPDLTEKPTNVEVRNEAHNGLSNRRGTIAMARAPDAIDSSTCQFFINLADNTFLDHQDRTADKYGYCVFGQVIKGIEVVERIAELETKSTAEFENLPAETVLIKSARQLR